jgi:hypothetical protein
MKFERVVVLPEKADGKQGGIFPFGQRLHLNPGNVHTANGLRNVFCGNLPYRVVGWLRR